MDAWQFLIKYESKIRGLLAKLCRYDDNVIDELWTNVVLERIQRIVLLHSVSERDTTLYTHVMNNISGYAYKYLVKRQKERYKVASLTDFDTESRTYSSLHIFVESDIVTKEMVNKLLSSLSTTQSAILIMRYFQKYNFEEIGDALGMARTTAMYHHEKALKEARDFLEADGITGKDT